MGCAAAKPTVDEPDGPPRTSYGAQGNPQSLTSKELDSISRAGSKRGIGASIRKVLPFGGGRGDKELDVSSMSEAEKAKLKGSYRFRAFCDRFTSIEQVQVGLRESGLESSNLIVAVDYTKSNLWQTKYGAQGLHTIAPGSVPAPGSEVNVNTPWPPRGVTENPYQRVIRSIGLTLSAFDDDGLIPVFGFGDSTTTDRSVFPFFPDRPARGFNEVLARYAELSPRVIMSGPTSFAPAIEAAIQIVKQTRQYHILLIIADGQVTNAAHTASAIVKASAVPLSIIIVGVGEGIDHKAMATMDDGLPQRAFDNIQYVRFRDEVTHPVPTYGEDSGKPGNPDGLVAMTDVEFAIAALQEIPDQYLAIRSLGLV